MANHANIGHLLLLFILLISAVGCYSAFGKQLPNEEGLSKLKMSSRNLKQNEEGLPDSSEISSDVDDFFGDNDNDNGNTDSDSESTGSSVDFDPYLLFDPYVLNGLLTIFRARQYSPQIADKIRQICKGKKCVDDKACNDVGKTPEAPGTTPVCGGCDLDAEKCTFNEVLPELESKEGNTETTEKTEDNTVTTEDTNQL